MLPKSLGPELIIFCMSGARGSSALGASAGGGLDHANGTRRHPPSTRARSRRRDERQGQHPTRRTQMMPARHHLRACASTCRSGVWRRPVLCERAAGVRLRLRLRHRSCSTMWSFEARLQETPGHHFRDSRCASRSRERTMAFFFPSRFRMSPIPYPLRNITRKRTVRCAAVRLGVSPLCMSL